MYIVKRTMPNGITFLTHEGWTSFRKDTPIELGNVIRFTSGEAERNPLPEGSEYLYFGCYKEMK